MSLDSLAPLAPFATLARERQAQICRAAAQIEDPRRRLGEPVAKLACHGPPPVAIDVQRKKMVQQVVAPSNIREELANKSGCGCLIGCSRRPRAWECLLG